MTTPKRPEGPLRTQGLHVERVAIPRLHLTVEKEAGKATSRAVVFDGDVCRIGTQPSSDLVVTDPTVSRFHCRLTREEHGWRVTDSGSLNGTYVDGVRIRDADIVDGGTLEIGESVVRLRGAEGEKQSILAMTPTFGSMAGSSRAMRKLFALVEKVAGSDINVLITGENGTGKELVAQEIVTRSPRAEKPFVVVDCGAISPNLVESELFGHLRGSFTGADRDRVGAFESADGGTVFLDEIGELPIELQPKLLRALEAKEIRRVGESKSRRVNVRVLSATNRDLDREVNRGTFREDLYFRLAVLNVHIPPLRERLEDLPALIHVFLNLIGMPEQEKLFTKEVVTELQKHDWPGNVRELRNYVERSVVLQTGSHAGFKKAMTGGTGGAPASADITVPFKIGKEQVIDEFERAYLTALLAASGGNMSQAARTAGIDRMYLHRLVQKHGLR